MTSDGETDSGRQRSPLVGHTSTTTPMGRMLVFVWCVGLLSPALGYPTDDKKSNADDRVGLDRPSTQEPPQVSECGLDALLGEVFGTSGNANCNNGQQQPGGNPPTGPGGNNNPNLSPLPELPPSGYTPYTPEDPQPNNVNPPPPSNRDCTCVQYYLCTDNNTINDDGVGLIDIRIKDDECSDYLEKCCGGDNIRPPDQPLTPKPPVLKPQDSRCGVRNFEGIGMRITGDNDNEAQYGEFPWMVAIVRPDKTLSNLTRTVSVYQCGGSLIHPQVVLTGAHCVSGKEGLVIRAGEWDTQTKNELFPTQDRKVSKVIIHEQFNSASLANDPALLILEKPVDMEVENVGLICLPGANENMDGRNCVASGWGKDLFGKEGTYQVILKRVDVPTVPRSQCLEALRKTRLGARFKLHESFICAGGKLGKDTCKGDGGSPLVCPSTNNPNVYVQAGIVAWGIECGKETPGVYVNIPAFVNWIYNKLQAEGISIDNY